MSAQEVQELVKGDRNVPLVVDFFATWCGPCILMAQELEMVCSIEMFAHIDMPLDNIITELRQK